MNDTTRPTFRTGLVGAGYICEYHVAAIRDIGGEIVGVFDIDEARAAATAERLSIPARPSLAALVEAGANVIHVLTPPHTHAAVTLEAMERGCHVLVEKPLTEDLDECDRLVEAAAEHGVKVCVNHSLLYDPQVLRALEVVRSGKLGQVVSVDILRGSDYPPYPGGPLPPQYRRAGYPFRDLGVHALYLFEAFLGPIEEVKGEWESLGGDTNLAFDEWRALVRCERGLGQFQLSWNVKPIQSQIIIHGTKGILRVDLFSMFQARRASTPLPKAAERIVNAISDSVEPLVDVPVSVIKFVGGKVKSYQGLRNLVAAFYQALERGAPVPVTLEDAARVVRWTEHVARAADADHEAQRAAEGHLAETVPWLVTGASGALGSAVVARLRERGERVRIFVRRRPATVPEGVELVVGNLGDPEAVDRAVRGAARVIHVGAAMKGGAVDHACATVVGTQNVVASCLRHGVEKLVHISSMSVIDFAGGDAPVDEQTAYEPHPEQRGAYTQSKLQAERTVLSAVRDERLPAVVLRPGQIFGGRIPLMTGAVARRLGGRWLVLGDGEVRLPLVYIDDVVDAIMSAAEGPLRDGEVIQLVDSDTLTQNEVLSMVVGDPDRVVRVPRPFLFFTGKLTEPLLGALGRQSPVSAYRLRSALAKRTFAAQNAALIDWRPRVGVRAGIERARETGSLGAAIPARADE